MLENLNEEKLTITPLGAGLEVGRSCIVLSYKGKNVMVKQNKKLVEK
jgi:hypothetical protein